MEIKIIAIFTFIIIKQVHCKQVLRQRRDGECQECDLKANFNSMAYCYETDPTRCCRVCEPGYFRDGTGCTENNGELGFSCSKCGEGTYQDSYNIDQKCKDCSSPSIICAENEMISQDCHKYYGDYKCVPIPTTASMANNAISTSSGPGINTTKEDSTTVQTPKPEKSAGDKNNTSLIVGATIGAIAFIVLCVVILLVFLHKHGHFNVFPTRRERLPSHANTAQQNPERNPNEFQRLQERTSLDSTDNSHPSQTPGEEVMVTEEEKVHYAPGIPPSDGADDSPLIDDSHNYVLKKDVNFWGFVTSAARMLPPDASKIHPLYSGLKLDYYDVQNAEENGVNNVEKRIAVLRIWSEQSTKNDPEKVCQLLSMMWKVKLRKQRRDLIEECCQKVSSSV